MTWLIELDQLQFASERSNGWLMMVILLDVATSCSLRKLSGDVHWIANQCDFDRLHHIDLLFNLVVLANALRIAAGRSRLSLSDDHLLRWFKNRAHVEATRHEYNPRADFPE
jgi:hypothetical protein